MYLKFINTLVPADCLRGECDAKEVIPRFCAEPVYMNLDTLMCVEQDRLSAPDHKTQYDTLCLRFSSGDLYRGYHVTFSEFERLFGREWPSRKHVDENAFPF